ncbi:arginyl-tRNA synthetase [Candidatus Kryptonium thompsonii]|mgnify:CR=1 FL=1|uniref:Arginine--tRNA ligase n=1 Tax=Candidatus Kryptonium thompsonii TaxID=1633631 RepID=A0A0P1P4C0_9BACT|nr:arginine--tRNA ligase [Candidatus Kryptonium thompsoni]CUS76397.1 arginyl-tRNA synthetase [Candidatus Kryptonium thompsoni]CUS76499.1 arginyl-tRNA synthetase [Candidatus Kryptonium thompsoni]CUS79613.1 arginyl-tRNA synthetase [Candidatus Kryptonium thompsoni]CUS85025.1 arginyl-tRNA synthetase [Candidatus Kryptonium thompsoni]CUS86316.1 arginyl-tRNA synthetase [Candidatus Kryptonium thompsoni]
MFPSAREYLREKLKTALDKLGIQLDGIDLTFDKPKNEQFGDFATNIAMLIAKKVGKAPREIAGEIVANLDIEPELIEKVEVAGPGFINFKLTPKFYIRRIYEILNQGENFGRLTIGKGKKANVEFVSANPTGPLTVGHGRNAVLGDTIANILEWVGYDVTREYYFNNAGRQMKILADSIRLRYLELLGEKIDYPEEYYQGEYIKDIAKMLLEEYGDSLKNESDLRIFKEKGESVIFDDIKKTLERLGIKFDVFYNEDWLYEKKIWDVVSELEKLGYVYEKDGAKWFMATKLGGEQDKVLVKSTGEPTYRLPDIAYHIEKFKRGFDLIIDVFGADHIAEYPDVLRALDALGYDISKVKVLIYQFVTIVKDGEVVKMSTRKANYITLDELIDEVTPDVVRFFFLNRSRDAHLNFDLNLAKKQSEENPVYYLQYAHARIASILRFAKDSGIKVEKIDSANIELLREKEEVDLAKLLGEFPDVVEVAYLSLEPLKIINYLNEVAEAFHRFYHRHRVVNSSDMDLTFARLSLCLATKIVIANGLKILGISRPEKM